MKALPWICLGLLAAAVCLVLLVFWWIKSGGLTMM